MSSDIMFGIITGTESFAMLVLLALMLAVIIGDDKKKPENRLFFHLCLALSFSLGTDIAYEIFERLREPFSLIRLLAAANYVAIECAMVLFTFYMLNVIRRKAFINSDLGYVVIFIVCFFCILFCVDIYQNTGWFVIIKDGMPLTSGPGWWFVASCPVGIGIFDVILFWSCQKEYSLGQVLVWISYLAIPLPTLFFVKYLGTGIELVAFTMSLLIVYLFEHVRNQRRLVETEIQLEASKCKLMLSQIQPHFMYNSLNSIYYLIEKNPEEAQEALSTFSDYLRQNINSLKSDKPVDFSAELSHTKAYLDLEKIRFGSRLTIITDIRTMDFKIPPLTLQPLVENAVKYGITSRAEGGWIKISSVESTGYNIIKVEDNGVGLKEQASDSSHTHIGISNVRSRLQSYCNGNVDVSPREGGGVISTIFLPREV